MTDYDDLFSAVTPDESVFTDKAALDPLHPRAEIIARTEQQERLARMLTGVHQGHLPTTVSVYGPPGTGKSLTVRRVTTEFADRTDKLAVEYVNLQEARSIFSAANQICFELTGEKCGTYVGVDGVFDEIWSGLDEYPEWTVLILDEIDQIQLDANYDPNDIFYRLLRGEQKLERSINLSLILISNEL